MAAKKRAAKKAPKAAGPAGKPAAEVPGDAPKGAAEAGRASVKKAGAPAGRRAARAPKKTIPADDEAEGVERKGIKRGDRVQVLKGEYGNTRGTVVGIDRMAIGVVLDNRVRQPALPFLRTDIKRC